LYHARTIVSFGAPLLDGWGGPGFARHWSEDRNLQLIQIEPTLSRTAGAATQWLANRQGSEAAVAGAIAHVLQEEHLAPRGEPVPPMPSDAGLPMEQVRLVARTIAASGPAVAIPADESPAVAALNIVLGAVGSRGGIVRKNDRPEMAEDSTEHPRAVLIDATVPWDVPDRWDAEVFRFAAWEGERNTADWLLPAPGFLEELTDVPASPASADETYAVAPRLVEPLAGTASLAQFLGGVDAGIGSVEQEIQARCASLHGDHKGNLWQPQGDTVPLDSIESAAKLYEQLLSGGVWCGEPVRHPEFRCDLLREWPAAPLAQAGRQDWSLPVLPPLATKLYQESTLRS